MEILRNPPRPLVLRRVDEALPASNPPISDHKGEGKPPLPLPASSGSAGCWRAGATQFDPGAPWHIKKGANFGFRPSNGFLEFLVAIGSV